MQAADRAEIRSLVAARFPERPRFQLEDFDTLEPGCSADLVNGIWPRVGVCFLGGPSMSAKTFWSLRQSVAVVRGEHVLGRKSKAAGVLYIAAEGANGVRKRIKGLRQVIGALGGGFSFIGDAPDLTDEQDVARLRDAIMEAGRRAQATDTGRLGMVVIDTMSASIPGADENTAKDMSPVLARLQTLAGELEVLVLVVAHTGKDTERGLRGWSGLLANADGLIMLNAPNDAGLRSGTVVKVKDGLAGDCFAFHLDVVEVGNDDDGDAITTCVSVEDGPIAGTDRVSRAVAAKNSLVLRCFHMCAEAGQTEPVPTIPGVPSGTVGVRRDVLREKMEAEGFTTGTANPESIRRAMNRSIDRLITDKKLRGNQHMVWEIRQ
jgi:hypothetical protein